MLPRLLALLDGREVRPPGGKSGGHSRPHTALSPIHTFARRPAPPALSARAHTHSAQVMDGDALPDRRARDTYTWCCDNLSALCPCLGRGGRE
jgi:hypothetical protein